MDELQKKNEELTARVAELEKELAEARKDSNYWCLKSADASAKVTKLKAALKAMADIID